MSARAIIALVGAVLSIAAAAAPGDQIAQSAAGGVLVGFALAMKARNKGGNQP